MGRDIDLDYLEMTVNVLLANVNGLALWKADMAGYHKNRTQSIE